MDMQALEPKIEKAAKLMEMLSQPVRLRILCALSAQEWSVVKLAEQVSLSQPAMSHHLKKLRDAGLVQTRRDAQTIYYSLAGNEVESILKALQELYCPEDGPAMASGKTATVCG